MYGIYANIWGILMVNVTIYGIHGSYGKWGYPKMAGLENAIYKCMRTGGSPLRKAPRFCQERGPCLGITWGSTYKKMSQEKLPTTSVWLQVSCTYRSYEHNKIHMNTI